MRTAIIGALLVTAAAAVTLLAAPPAALDRLNRPEHAHGVVALACALAALPIVLAIALGDAAWTALSTTP